MRTLTEPHISWDEAIAETRARIQRMKAKVARLEIAIEYLEESKKHGDLWPSEKEANNANCC